ncbi:MAG: hypothetical protein Q7Q73_07215 [Verrucomicrobiota bacterium JB024]|nr:hypothetical protein [Verrucomicrobiota bacterium JB024]
MNHFFANLLGMLCLSSACLQAAGEQPLDIVAIESHSQWWPVRLTLLEDVQAPDGNIKAGRDVMLVRVEDGLVIADSGRMGMLTLQPEQTDLVERARARQDIPWSGQGKLSHELANKLIDPQTRRQNNPETFNEVDYLVILYGQLGTEPCQKLFAAVEAAQEQWSHDGLNCTVLFLPMQTGKAELMAAFEAGEVTWPSMFPYLSTGYIDVLHHQPQNGTLVLVDKNGRLLARVESEGEEQLSIGMAEVGRKMQEDKLTHGVAMPSTETAI